MGFKSIRNYRVALFPKSLGNDSAVSTTAWCCAWASLFGLGAAFVNGFAPEAFVWLGWVDKALKDFLWDWLAAVLMFIIAISSVLVFLGGVPYLVGYVAAGFYRGHFWRSEWEDQRLDNLVAELKLSSDERQGCEWGESVAGRRLARTARCRRWPAEEAIVRAGRRGHGRHDTLLKR